MLDNHIKANNMSVDEYILNIEHTIYYVPFPTLLLLIVSNNTFEWIYYSVRFQI